MLQENITTVSEAYCRSEYQKGIAKKEVETRQIAADDYKGIAQAWKYTIKKKIVLHKIKLAKDRIK